MATLKTIDAKLRALLERASTVTVNECLGFYLREHVQVICVAKRRQHEAADNLRVFFGKMTVDQIGIPECRSYTLGRAMGVICVPRKNGDTRSGGAGTVRRELAVLMAALNHAVKWKRLGRNDVPMLEKPKVKASRGTWLFADELAQLRDAADQRTRDFIDIAYYTGARRRSVEVLTWDQVDLERGRINLSRASDPDTKKRRPIVPISAELRPVLTRLREGNTPFVLGSNGPHGAGVARAAQRAGIRDLPARDMRPAGTLSPHILRHSRATHLLQAGVRPKAVADLLGDNVLTVLRVYGHACPDFMSDLEGETR